MVELLKCEHQLQVHDQIHFQTMTETRWFQTVSLAERVVFTLPSSGSSRRRSETLSDGSKVASFNSWTFSLFSSAHIYIACNGESLLICEALRSELLRPSEPSAKKFGGLPRSPQNIYPEPRKQLISACRLPLFSKNVSSNSQILM